MLTPDQEKMREAAKALQAAPGWHQNHAYFDAAVEFEALANPAAILALLDQVEAQGEQYAEREYEIWQGGFVVAGTAGKGALKEARHYAMMYSQDGPCDIVEVTRRKLPPPPEAA